MARTVLIVSYSFYPHTDIGGRRAIHLYKHLDRSRWTPVVVTQIPRSLPCEPTADVLRAGQEVDLECRSTLDRARRHVERLVLGDFFVPWGLAVYRCPEVRQAAAEADMIFVTLPPFGIAIGAMALARRFKKPLVVDFRDPWTFNGNTYGHGRGAPNHAVHLHRHLERTLFKNAAAVTFINESIRLAYSREYPEWADRFHTIYSGWDASSVQGSTPIPRVDGEYLVVHGGHFYGMRQARPLAEATALARRAGVPVRLRLIGDIDPESRPAIERGEFDGVEALGTLSELETHRHLLAADAVAIVGNFQSGGELFLPGKFYEALAVRKPVLAIAPEGELTRQVQQLKIGVTCYANDGPAIQPALEMLVRTRPVVANGACDRFQLEAAIGDFDRTFERVLA